MSAQNTFMTAIKASEKGAYDYLPKPFDLTELIAIIGRALAEPKRKPAKSDDDLQDGMPLVGRSAAMQEIYRVLARLMQTDLTLMITGESGTGKELVARALHDYGKRRNGPFVAINMAAIPRDLIESELFGHEKGAFTGAQNRSTGRFEQAEGGTLFLDEIGDMPMEAQTRLLRVLQQGEYTTVGGRTPIRTDVRIVAATNKDLKQSINQGLFREDLYYRLNVVPLRLPPLRDRAEDIPDLVRHFVQQAEKEGLDAKRFDHGGARTDEGAILAGQRARAGEPRAPADGALSAGRHHPRDHRDRTAARTMPDSPIGEDACRAAVRSRSRRRWRRTCGSISPASATACRRRPLRPGAGRNGVSADPRGVDRHARQPDQGGRSSRPQPQHAAQEDPGTRRHRLSQLTHGLTSRRNFRCIFATMRCLMVTDALELRE